VWGGGVGGEGEGGVGSDGDWELKEWMRVPPPEAGREERNSRQRRMPFLYHYFDAH